MRGVMVEKKGREGEMYEKDTPLCKILTNLESRYKMFI
jgi:hypothetical protein